MPINAYTGLMRSGKSYEVVSKVILEAIANGRRVVTNVDGISNDLIREYLHEKRSIELVKLGEVVHVTNEDVFKPDFFPYYDDSKNAVTATLVQPGDLVAIDEAWRFWGTDCKLLKEHKSFFLEHGHFTHPETGVACDLVVMIQDIGTLHRFVKNVVAFTFRTHKKVALGLAKTYSIEMWEGAKLTKRTRISSSVRRYDKAIFPLYSSFKGGAQGKVVNVDKRQNLLANPKLWAVVGFFVVLFIASVWGLIYAWNAFKARAEGAKGVHAESPTAQQAVSASTAANARPAASPAPVTGDLRVAGEMLVHGQRWIVVIDTQGRPRFENPAAFVGRGVMMVGTIEGKRVTAW